MKFFNVIIIFVVFSVLISAKKIPSIVVIGAGAAGLSVAKKLLVNGFHNLKILEAESRLGGRISSVYFGENYVDLGATFCHGEEGNIVYSSVKNLNLLAPSALPKKFYYSSKHEIDTKFGEELYQIINKIYPHEDDSMNNIPYGQFIEAHWNKIVYEKFGTNKEKQKIAEEAIKFLELKVLGNEGSSTWYEGSMANDYRENEGDLTQNWKGKGYKIFLDVVLQKYPDDSGKISDVEEKIIFNKEVSKISYNFSEKWHGVSIVCKDKSEFKVDHVIITPSLGVLKENHMSLFNPALPLSKQKAIENMGFGVIMKVAMYYSNIWWDSNFRGFNIIWSDEDLEKANLEFYEGPNFNNRSWITYTSSILRADENPKVLMAWFAGILVPKIELLSEKTLANGVTYLTQKFLGHIFNVTKPDKIIHSTWHKNSHFRGAFSYQTLEASKRSNPTNAQEDLAVPIRNAYGRPFVHFAGEGTHSYYYSNVQGAVESGLREADVIISYYSSPV